MNNPTIITKEAPFKHFCMSIGALPTSYKDSLDYYETLLWLIKYLEETIIPTVNNNGLAVAELQGLYVELKNYVDNYFTNLDVQEEINNKLDNMILSGQFNEIIGNYIDPKFNEYSSELSNSVNNKLELQDNAISSLQSMINGITSSSPIPVSSTSSMIDTSKIYVLTTNGYWYYYNGEEWTQGGLYQSSQSTDETLGALLQLKELNCKKLFDWIVGDINPSGIIYSDYRICTNSINQLKFDLYLSDSEKIKYGIWSYSDATGNDATWLGWRAGNDNKATVIKAGTYFRLLIDYNSNSDPDRIVITNAYTSTLFANLSMYNYFDYRNYFIRNNDIIKTNAINSPIYDTLIACGDISNGIPNLDITLNRRLITMNILHYDYDLIVPYKDTTGNAYYLVTYSNDQGANYNNIGWINNNYAYIIPKGTYFRLLMSVNDTNSVTKLHDIFNTSIYKNIEIKKYEPKINNNCLSVSHQGYSLNTKNSVYGNSRVSSYKGAKIAGFDIGECDLQWTSDGIAVCCHDASFVSGEETIVISEHTYAELITYNYYGETIASFDEVVEICKTLGLGLYVDHIASTLTDTQYTQLFNTIKKYGMLNKTKFLVNNITRAETILSYYSKAKIAIVTEDNDLSSLVNDVNNLQNENNEISIDFKWGNITEENLISYNLSLNPRSYLECWTVDNVNNYKTAMKYCRAITSNRICSSNIE